MSKKPAQKIEVPAPAAAVPLTDPMGTVGASSAAAASKEYMDIASGGANFVARMQKHADLVAQNEAALAKLAIGKDIEGAKKRAEALVADAELQNKKARDALDEAQKKAADIVNNANKHVEATSNAMLAEKKKVEEEAAQIRKDAHDYAALVRADVDKAREDTIERGNRAKATEDAAIAAKAQYEDSAKKAAKAASDAAALAKDLQSRIDRLNAAIRDVTT